jgi:hypothetical protein
MFHTHLGGLQVGPADDPGSTADFGDSNNGFSTVTDFGGDFGGGGGDIGGGGGDFGGGGGDLGGGDFGGGGGGGDW